MWGGRNHLKRSFLDDLRVLCIIWEQVVYAYMRQPARASHTQRRGQGLTCLTAIKYAPALVSPLTLMCTKPQVELSSAMWTDGRSPAEVLKLSAETSACGCCGG